MLRVDSSAFLNQKAQLPKLTTSPSRTMCGE